MKNFSQLIKELPAKKVVMAFGRFQPPTNGHELLVNAVKKIAAAQGADHVIFASRTQDKKSNPLPVDRKVYYLKRMFPKTKFAAASDTIRTFIEAAKFLSGKYQNLVMIAGSDRVQEYKTILEKYNGKEFKFDTIEVVSAGERDPDSDSAAGMSGTKMREAAKSGDFAMFKKGLPKAMTELDGKRLMNEIRVGLSLDPVKESITFEKDELREKYFKEEIFLIGEKVTDGVEVFEIVDRRANYLAVVDGSGNISKKWLSDVVYAKFQEDITTGPIAQEITYKGYTTKNFHHSEDAAKAFQDTIARSSGRSHDPVAILNALKATDIYMGLNDKHLGGEQFTDEEKSQWIEAHEKARENLNKIGEFEHHEDYWHMHQHELEFALVGYGEAGKAEAMDESAKAKEATLMKYTATDKIKVAKIIASSLGVPDVDKSQNPEMLINSALRKIKNKPMRPEYMAVVNKMLKTAREAGIEFDEKLVPAKVEEAITVVQGGSMVKQGTIMMPDLDPERDHIRKKKIRYHLGEEDKEADDFEDDMKANDDIDEKDIDGMVNSLTDDDIFSMYDDEELHIIDDDTGEKIEEDDDEGEEDEDEDEEDEDEKEIKEEALNEVLSRAERIKAKMRFARTSAKRERRLKIAIRTRSSATKINKRARRLAVKLLKQRIAKKPLNTLSTAEKERIEGIIQRRKAVISRIALRLAPKVRKIENDRLTHKTFTKG
jgi:hypothetical protein